MMPNGLILDAAPFSQIGEGYFAVMIDQGQDMTPYQGFTPIAGGLLSDCAQTYFAQSEQIPTRFALTFGRSQMPGDAARWRAGGVMLQHMPAGRALSRRNKARARVVCWTTPISAGAEAENWTRANALLDTVEEIELIGSRSHPPICWCGCSTKKARACSMPRR